MSEKLLTHHSSLITHHSSLITAFVFGNLLLDLRLDPFALDVEAQPAVEAHVLVRHPYEREAADEVAAPVFVEQFVARDEEEEYRYVVAEAVFAGEQVEEFSLVPARARLALPDAELARLAKGLLVRHSPRETRYGDGE